MKPQGNVEDYDQSIIKELREKKKWSRRELAEKSGITQQTILNVEQNRFPASLSTITSIIDALEIDFSRYVNISHRYKSAILQESNIVLDTEIDHSIRFYEYNGFFIGNFIVNDTVYEQHLARLPHFNIFTYVISGCIDLNIDGDNYTVGPNECISLSGLSKRNVSIRENCNTVTILKNKCNPYHSHSPLEDLSTVIELYPRHIDSEKEISICKEDMDFSFIKFLRHTKNMSLDSLAEAAGLSTSAISLIENNKRAPSLASISTISAALKETTINFFTMAQKIKTKQADAIEYNNHLITNTEHGIKYNFLRYDQETILQSNSSHPFCLELHMPVEGEMTVSIEDGDFEIRPGNVLAFDGMRPHTYKPKKGYVGLAVELPKDKIIAEQP